MNKKIKIGLVLILAILIVSIVYTGFVHFYFKNHKNISGEKVQTQTIKITDQKIVDKTNPLLDINIVYPQIVGPSGASQDSFNKLAQNIVQKELTDFKTNSLENDSAVKKIDPVDYAKYPRTYYLSINYTKGEVDENLASIVFNVENFEGGAHGAHYPISLNYNFKTQKEIKLADLFAGQKDYLQKISDFCITDLTTQITKSAGSTDGSWIKDGAEPKDANYQTFLIDKNNLVFYFPEYQVAAYVFGQFTVSMPR